MKIERFDPSFPHLFKKGEVVKRIEAAKMQIPETFNCGPLHILWPFQNLSLRSIRYKYLKELFNHVTMQSVKLTLDEYCGHPNRCAGSDLMMYDYAIQVMERDIYFYYH